MLDTFLSTIPFVFVFLILYSILDSMGIRNIREEYTRSSKMGKRALKAFVIAIGAWAIGGIIASASSGFIALPFYLGTLALYGMLVLRYADAVSQWFNSRRQQFARIARSRRNDATITDTG